MRSSQENCKGRGKSTLKSSIFFITTSDVRGYLANIVNTLDRSQLPAHIAKKSRKDQSTNKNTIVSLNNGVAVQPSVLGGHSAALVLGVAGGLEGRGAVEMNRGTNLGLGPHDSLLNVSGGGLGFGGGSLDWCWMGTVRDKVHGRDIQNNWKGRKETTLKQERCGYLIWVAW